MVRLDVLLTERASIHSVRGAKRKPDCLLCTTLLRLDLGERPECQYQSFAREELIAPSERGLVEVPSLVLRMFRQCRPLGCLATGIQHPLFLLGRLAKPLTVRQRSTRSHLVL